MKNLTPIFIFALTMLFIAAVAHAQDADAKAKPKANPKAKQVSPISYAGQLNATSAADGGQQPVVGVHNIQVVRGNRTVSPHADGLPHTYLHQPMLAFWKGRFFLEYISSNRDEEEEGTTASITTSPDGLRWEKPRVVFPPYKLPDGRETVVLIRAGFYVARDTSAPKSSEAASPGRLLVMGFHGKPKTPDDPAGPGIGRVVREVFCDDKGALTFGPVYFLRYNRTQNGFVWDESNTPYPFYKKSPDAGFVAACDSLVANKLIVKQWEEEDPFAASVPKDSLGKAMSFTHRPDGTVVAVYKYARANTSADEGRTWTRMARVPNLLSNGSKYWIHRTGDGRYALVFSPTEVLRQPLSVATSDDCREFDGILNVHGETPDMRFPGEAKDLGPQYVRGIVEGNGTPPDGNFWLTYSVNKEDIWIARVPVPIRGAVALQDKKSISENFDDLPAGAMPATWNLYCPSWTSIRVADAESGNRALELRDEEPHDYARAVRVFPATHGVRVSFRILPRQTNARLEIELEGAHGARPTRIAFCEDGRIRGCSAGIWQDAGAYTAGTWHQMELYIQPVASRDGAKLRINGKGVFREALTFVEPAATVERLSFRTGAYRENGYGGLPLGNVDERAQPVSFLMDDVVITPVK